MTSQAKAYQRDPDLGNPARTEAWALLEAARELHQSKDGPIEDFRAALRKNWRLWTIFQASLSEPDCPVPAPVRRNLLGLSNFIDRQTADLLAVRDAKKVDALVNINRQISEGLLEGQRAATGTQAKAPCCPDVRPSARICLQPRYRMMLLSKSDGSVSADDRLRDIVDHLNHGETSEALALLRPLLEADPLQPCCSCFVLAMTAWKLERFDWALSLLRECHDAAPDDGGIADAFASLLGQLGRLEESLFTGKLATALGIDPVFAALVPKGYPTFERAFLSIVEKPLLGKARKAYAQGKLAKATEFARQHVVVEPDHIEGRAFHAECLMRAGAAGDAIETLAVLSDETPATAELQSLYAHRLDGGWRSRRRAALA